MTDDDIQKALDDAIKQSFNGSQEKYQAYIKKYGLTDEEVREFLVRPSVVQKKVQDKLTGDQKITDADVQKYYDEHKAEYVDAGHARRAVHPHRQPRRRAGRREGAERRPGLGQGCEAVRDPAGPAVHRR